MLNFAERTGSGAVMLVWSFLTSQAISQYTTYSNVLFESLHRSLWIAKATTNADLESASHASSLRCLSRVLLYTFTITDMYPTTKAVWGVVWETNLLQYRYYYVRAELKLFLAMLHWYCCLWCLISSSVNSSSCQQLPALERRTAPATRCEEWVHFWAAAHDLL